MRRRLLDSVKAARCGERLASGAVATGRAGGPPPAPRTPGDSLRPRAAGCSSVRHGAGDGGRAVRGADSSVDPRSRTEHGLKVLKLQRSRASGEARSLPGSPATVVLQLQRSAGRACGPCPARGCPGAGRFETAVVCLSGSDAGTVYATLLWGFTTDAALKVTPRPQRATTKQSRDFGSAVEQWNEQAADPTRPQNSPNQIALPTLR